MKITGDALAFLQGGLLLGLLLNHARLSVHDELQRQRPRGDQNSHHRHPTATPPPHHRAPTEHAAHSTMTAGP
jgi:hypothetical protein